MRWERRRGDARRAVAARLAKGRVFLTYPERIRSSSVLAGFGLNVLTIESAAPPFEERS